MATKSSTKTKKADTTKKTISKNTATKHDLLYIMSPQCGWCKKADPVVAELVKDGAKITTVDITTPEGLARSNEVKTKYNAQCGTPLFLDAETGNSKCGFAEKDVLEKWVAGEEIPQPPQPKSPPPPPPMDLESASDDEVKAWRDGYEKWVSENKHMPNLLPFDQIDQRVRQSQLQRKNAPAGAPGAPGAPGGASTPGSGDVDSNHTFNTDFYYVVINTKKEVVMADMGYITSLKHQYFQRENDGRLTKVVGDGGFSAAYSGPGTAGNASRRPAGAGPFMDPTKKSGGTLTPEQIEELKSKSDKTRERQARTKLVKGKADVSSKRKSKNTESRENKKTIDNF